MEVPVTNRIIPELEAVEIPPTLVSHFLSFQVTRIYIFFKWGALFLALVASFTALIKNIHFIILTKYHTHPSSQPLLPQLTEEEEEEEDLSDSDSDSLGPTLSSSTHYSDAEYEDDRWVGATVEDFIVKGNLKDRWQIGNFSLRGQRNVSVLGFSSLITAPVVKMWDNVGLRGLGLALDINNNNNNNNNNDDGNSNLTSLFSPYVVVSAERNPSGRFLKVWDTREGRWIPRFGESSDVVKVSGTGRVFVRDDVTGGLTVGDMRKVGTPLLDADVDTWLDADAVIVGREELVEL